MILLAPRESHCAHACQSPVLGVTLQCACAPGQLHEVVQSERSTAHTGSSWADWNLPGSVCCLNSFQISRASWSFAPGTLMLGALQGQMASAPAARALAVVILTLLVLLGCSRARRIAAARGGAAELQGHFASRGAERLVGRATGVAEPVLQGRALAQKQAVGPEAPAPAQAASGKVQQPSLPGREQPGERLLCWCGSRR